MNRMDYFLELYGRLPRAGPGDDASTARAFRLLTELPASPRILDVGCGPGRQTQILARESAGLVIAIDIFSSMLKRAEEAAGEAGLSKRVVPVRMDMNAPGLKESGFDVIWSEGAVYIMGFEAGLRTFRKFLKKGGYIVVTEPVWLTEDPSDEALRFWEEYPAIDTPARKLEIIRTLGLTSVGSFVLPSTSWTEEYYAPLEERVEALEKIWEEEPVGREVLEEARKELAGYRLSSSEFSYAFFIMRLE